jgi:hypothetical protein
LLDHRRDRCLEEVGGPLEASGDDLMEVLEGRVHEPAGDDLPGEGGGRVDPTELVERGGKQSMG